MHFFCYFLGITLVMSPSRGDSIVDFRNSVDEQSVIQNPAENLKDRARTRTGPVAAQESEPTEFTCQFEGRYPDLSDSTCMRYFQCERMNDGTFAKKSFKCSNSTFCSSTQKCSSVYVCPCVGTTNGELQEPSTTEKTTGYSCLPGEVIDFNCLSVGRFADTSDIMCQTYFLCSYLQNGSYVKTTYKCRNSYFNPAISRCSANFTCPCSDTTTASSLIAFTTLTTQYVTNGTVSTSAATSTPSSSASSENVTISSVTTSDTLSPNGCTITSKEFECVQAGRFPDFSDVTCKHYFLCSELQNGTYIKTPYECRGSSFNPLTFRCSTSYLCPCTASETTLETTPMSSSSTTLPTVILTTEIITPTAEVSSLSTATNPSLSSTTPSTTAAECISSTQEFECFAKGRFADLSDVTCRKYFLCSLLQNGTLIKTSYRCPINSAFYPPIQRCNSEYICPCSSSTPTTTILPTSSTKLPTVEPSVTTPILSSESTSSISSSVTPIENITILTSSLPISSEAPDCKISLDDFVCSSKGRFPDLSDITCQKYFLCSLLNNGSFIQTRYRCPTSSYFYPPSEKCSTAYRCPCLVTTSTSSSVTTSSFANLSTVENTKTTITGSSEFPVTSPASLGSTSAYSNATSISSISTVGCTVSNKEFLCTAEGRFPDLSDITCTRYFLCSKLQNGTFIQTPYTCLDSTFNPLLCQCSLSYICPCNAEHTSVTTPMQSVSTSEGYTKLPTTTSSVVITTSPITTTVSYSCSASSGSVPEFTCSSVGRYPDYSDNTCRRYFLCSQLLNGTFIKTPYNCPISSCIISSTQRCSSVCICPCLN